VREKIVLRAFFVRFQCIVENLLDVGQCGSATGSRESVRHKGT
jgi:hypothetical protein